MHHATRAVAAAAATALLAAGLAPAASAAPAFTDTFEEDFSDEVEDFCGVEGLRVLVAGTATGRMFANQRGRDKTTYGSSVFREEIRFTTLDDAGSAVPGRFATEVNQIRDKDLHVTDNGDGTRTVQVLATGNTVWRGPDGRRLGGNPGQVRFTLLLDDSGTPHDPFDDEFLEFLSLDKDSTGRNDDFCEAMLPVLAP